MGICHETLSTFEHTCVLLTFDITTFNGCWFWALCPFTIITENWRLVSSWLASSWLVAGWLAASWFTTRWFVWFFHFWATFIWACDAGTKFFVECESVVITFHALSAGFIIHLVQLMKNGNKPEINRKYVKPALALAEPSTMKPSPLLSMQVSFLHRTKPFSTAAGSSHLVHLPSSPETAGLSPAGLSPVGLLPLAKAKALNKI